MGGEVEETVVSAYGGGWDTVAELGRVQKRCSGLEGLWALTER